jgi:hypothetical protein
MHQREGYLPVRDGRRCVVLSESELDTDVSSASLSVASASVNDISLWVEDMSTCC